MNLAGLAFCETPHNNNSRVTQGDADLDIATVVLQQIVEFTDAQSTGPNKNRSPHEHESPPEILKTGSRPSLRKGHLMLTVRILSLSLAFALFAATANAAPRMSSGTGSKSSSSRVSGHTTKSGTQVAPHSRSTPDKSKSNNWSTKGNTNPKTGKAGTK